MRIPCNQPVNTAGAGAIQTCMVGSGLCESPRHIVEFWRKHWGAGDVNSGYGMMLVGFAVCYTEEATKTPGWNRQGGKCTKLPSNCWTQYGCVAWIYYSSVSWLLRWLRAPHNEKHWFAWCVYARTCHETALLHGGCSTSATTCAAPDIVG